MVRGRRWCAAIAGAACGLVMAACSSEPEVSAPTVELSTTTVTTLPPTTEPVTTEAPTTTEDPRIAEVEAAVAEYRRVFVEVLTNPDVPVDELEEVSSDGLLETVVGNVLKERATSESTSGQFLVEPRSTTFEDDNTASHLSCGLDALAGFDATGELILPADDEPVLRRYALRRAEGANSWLVTEIVFDGVERTTCSFDS